MIIAIFNKLLLFTYWYLRWFFPLVLTVGVVITLIAMAVNFGTKMGLALIVFVVGVFIASYIIYGNKIFNVIFNFNSRGIRSFLNLSPRDNQQSMGDANNNAPQDNMT